MWGKIEDSFFNRKNYAVVGFFFRFTWRLYPQLDLLKDADVVVTITIVHDMQMRHSIFFSFHQNPL